MICHHSGASGLCHMFIGLIVYNNMFTTLLYLIVCLKTSHVNRWCAIHYMKWNLKIQPIQFILPCRYSL